MQNALTILAVIWVVIAIVIGALALYRKYISREEVDVIHLRDSEATVVTEQSTLASRLAMIDHWGKTLTIVLIVFGVIIAGWWLVIAWKESVQPTS